MRQVWPGIQPRAFRNRRASLACHGAGSSIARKVPFVLFSASFGGLLWLGCEGRAGSGARTAESYPAEALQWTIAFGAGGGNDVMARTLIDILQRYELYRPPIVAQNRPAGSGAVGWGFVFNQAGNPYHISTTSGSFITTPKFANTPWGPTSFTPVALLATDDVLLVVDRRSEIQSLEEFIERAKATAPTIGGMGTVQVDFMVSHLLARAAGFEVRYVPFNSEGALISALLSRSIDAMVANPAMVFGLLESGDLRPLAYSGAAVPDALSGVPTLRERGFPQIAVSMPRGLILPPDVSPDVQRWWIETIEKVVRTPEWQNYLDANFLTEALRYGDDFQDFLIAQSGVFEEMLREFGILE